MLSNLITSLHTCQMLQFSDTKSTFIYSNIRNKRRVKVIDREYAVLNIKKLISRSESKKTLYKSSVFLARVIGAAERAYRVQFAEFYPDRQRCNRFLRCNRLSVLPRVFSSLSWILIALDRLCRSHSYATSAYMQLPLLYRSHSSIAPTPLLLPLLHTPLPCCF